tara:strand:+ start:1280 stop:1426 length:147 start_codon:yes stop_codon:yes gene_type:complete
MKKSKNQLALAERKATSNAFKQFAYGIAMTLFFSYAVFIAIVCISNAL